MDSKTILLVGYPGAILADFGVAAASAAELRVTTFEDLWQDLSTTVVDKTCCAEAIVKLALDKADQVMIGFGTCMSELSHEELWHLSEADRTKVTDEIFSSGGCSFTVAEKSNGTDNAYLESLNLTYAPGKLLAEVVDADGTVCPHADMEIDFWPKAIATCSGDLTDNVPATSSKRKAWQGRALGITCYSRGVE